MRAHIYINVEKLLEKIYNMADEALFDENLDGIVQPEQVRYDEENIRHMSAFSLQIL